MKTQFKNCLLAAAITTGLAFTAPAVVLAGDYDKDKPKTERTVGQTIDDATITASVKSKLLADERTEGFDINVDTHNGKVTLRGGADSEAAKMAAAQLARTVDGVSGVDNMIVVAAEGTQARQAANTATASGKARETMSQTGEVIDDAWITSKVKSKLIADSNVPGTDITVETKANVVHLRGVVATNELRAEAIRIAETTEGVRNVIADQLTVRGGS
jgi:hyperosmotically inducible periplasmic protein